MRFATTKEKIELLDSGDRERAQRLMMKGRLEVNEEDGRLAPKIDIRELINAVMDEEGIPRNVMSRRLGKRVENMRAFYAGRIPVPLTTIEEILWLLDPESMVIDE